MAALRWRRISRWRRAVVRKEVAEGLATVAGLGEREKKGYGLG